MIDLTAELAELKAIAESRRGDHPDDAPELSMVGCEGDHPSMPGKWARYKVAGRCRRGCANGWKAETYDGPVVACECASVVRLVTRMDNAVMPVRALELPTKWSDAHGMTMAQAERMAARILAGEPGRFSHGGTGTGKSWRAMAVSMAAMRQGGTVRWAHWPSFCEAARWAVDGGAGASRDLRRPLERCDILVVDDLGQGRKTEYGVDLTDGVIGARAEDGRAIVVTSNLDQAAARKYLGERTWSRLTSVCVVAPVGGKSLRESAK